MTHGDEVRAMNNEELAYFLANEQIKLAEVLADKIDRAFHFSEEDMKNTTAEWVSWLNTDVDVIDLGGKE